MPAYLLTTFIFYYLQSVMQPVSEQALRIHKVFQSFNIAAGGMLLLVMLLVLYICIKYRGSKNQNSEPAQTKGNNIVEAFMIGIPTLLLAYFFYQTVVIQKEIHPSVPEGRQADVVITAHQWWWEARYPDSVVTANEIHLPIGKKLLLQFHTADVIHDWWVPQLGNKTDIIPNTTNYLWITIPKVGVYNGACSEFCGAQHAWMRIKVIAQTPDDYAAWLAVNKKPAQKLTDSLALTGYKLYSNLSCVTCHNNGAGTGNDIGPNLQHVASRGALLTGILAMNEQNLYKWISGPQQIKPGAHMPDFKLPADSLKAIAHYLAQLK